MKKLIISGSPGTGKTTISKYISDILKNTHLLSLNDIVIKKKFTLSYDKDRDTHVADFEKLLPYVNKKIKNLEKRSFKYLIIEGHFADIIPSKFIDYIFILRCHPDILKERLNEREYSEKKIYENLQAEILGNCTNFLLEKELNKPIYELDTTTKSPKDSAKIIIRIIKNQIDTKKYKVGKINWMEDLSKENRLIEFFEY
ncbi:MAG: adenylate kinase family protein [Promethearchaeia archaeon]